MDRDDVAGQLRRALSVLPGHQVETLLTVLERLLQLARAPELLAAWRTCGIEVADPDELAAWLVAQGREIFYRVTSSADALVGYLPADPDDVWDQAALLSLRRSEAGGDPVA